jgi:energy-coupling factor transporter ATP-binding protein EcfA2
MQAKTRNKFLALGFSTVLIDKIAQRDLSFSGLQNQSMKALLHAGFTKEEADIILSKTKRAVIAKGVMEQLLIDSGQVCAFCANGNSSQPFQIHHIEEYHLTQDNSESNLLLVCPSHHVYIHQEGVTREFQLSMKRKWCQTWRIARQYQAKGLTFPFKGFEALDYQTVSPVTAIFSFSAPSPGLCKELLSAHTRQHELALLQKHHKLLLAGASGNGKSTLAKGIAGAYGDFEVFNYAFPRDGSDHLQEMLQFLSLNVEPVILIVDDANRYLSMYQVEILLKAATARAQVILIKTGLDKEDMAIEAHFVDVLLDVNWKMLQSDVEDLFRRHEKEITTYLVHQEGAFIEIGLGHLDRSILRIVDQMKDTVNNVWEFVYLLSNGLERCHRLFRRLQADGNLHLVVAFIGANQIANADKGVTLEEIEQLYITHPTLNTAPPPERKWLEDQLDILIRHHRVVKVSRGRYNTVHRQFASHFIDHLLLTSRNDIAPFLAVFLNDPNKFEEILRVWSWLEDKPNGRLYIQQWRNSLTMADWQQMVTRAASINLFLLTQLTYRLYLISPHESQIIQHCFPPLKEQIIHLITTKPEYIIIDCRYLFNALERNCQGLIREILDGVGIERMCRIMDEIKVEEFESMTWFINTVFDIYPEWVAQIQPVFTLDFFERKANLVTKGRVNDLAMIILFERRFHPEYRLTRALMYIEKLAALLKNCPFDKIVANSTEVPFAFAESSYIESHVAIMCSGLDTVQLAKEMETAVPRHWDHLYTISELAKYCSGHLVIEQWLESIDVDTLVTNLEQYGPRNKYELRMCIYQLCHASPEKRKEFAERLYPLMVSLVPVIQSGSSDEVLNAYTRLSDEHAKQLARDYEVSASPYLTSIDESKESTAESVAHNRKFFQELEASGEDIDLSSLSTDKNTK